MKYLDLKDNAIEILPLGELLSELKLEFKLARLALCFLEFFDDLELGIDIAAILGEPS